MFNSSSELKSYIKTENVKQIDFIYVDLIGRLRHVTIPASTIGSSILAEGVGFDGSGAGFKKTYSSDMGLLIPESTTAFIDPFCKMKTISLFCKIIEADTKEPFPFDPRGLAKRTEHYLSQLGWVDTSSWGPELEFHVFDKVSYHVGMNESFYKADSCEGSAIPDDIPGGYQILPQRGYHAMPPTDSLYELRSEISGCLESLGIEVKYHHHEMGSYGQSEIEVPMKGLLKTADNIMLIKYVVKMICRKHDKTVTFMPKPIHGDNGNGLHVHQTLFKKSKNLFFDDDQYGGLSNIALSYIAGLFEHVNSLLAFTNPSTNSYRRLVPGMEAPTNLFFSLGNRTAAVRIPKYATSNKTKRIEFRTPDATCNIYYCLSAQLLAGIYGIEKKMDATQFGPIDEDVHQWSENKIRKLKALPANLEQALESLSHDNAFLLNGDVFSVELIDNWIEYKIKHELSPIRGLPHPFEYALYYDS